MTLQKEKGDVVQAALPQEVSLYNQYNKNTAEKQAPHNQTLKVALEYLKRGLPVFPCKAGEKVPLTRNGLLDASGETSVVVGWWNKWPDANLAIPTGKVSDIWVLDIDGEDAEHNLAKLEQQHGKLPASVEVITGSGNRHIWFKWPQGIDLRNSAGRIAPGIDVRGNGGYVICPPSALANGREYVWSVDCGQEIVNAPDWLLKLACGGEFKPKATSSDEWQRLMLGAGEGQRNDAISRIVGLLLRKNVDPYITLELIQAWNECRCSPPLSFDEVTKTVDSIARLELKRRAR